MITLLIFDITDDWGNLKRLDLLLIDFRVKTKLWLYLSISCMYYILLYIAREYYSQVELHWKFLEASLSSKCSRAMRYEIINELLVFRLLFSYVVILLSPVCLKRYLRNSLIGVEKYTLHLLINLVVFYFS